MATSGNRDWAFTEAKRRAIALNRPYTIYKAALYDDYIIKPATFARPDNRRWDRVIVIEANGAEVDPKAFYSM